jgi:hypothetical protein
MLLNISERPKNILSTILPRGKTSLSPSSLILLGFQNISSAWRGFPQNQSPVFLAMLQVI